MMKVISYVIPVMLNFVFGTFLFIMIQQLSEAGGSEFVKGLPLTVWAAVYGVLNLLTGKIVTVRNSAKFIVFSGIFVFLCALGMTRWSTQNMLFVWMAVLGVAFACYCVPFQLFAKGMESGAAAANTLDAVGKTAGRYTAAWSIGLACGPLVSGFSRQGGLYACMIIGVLITLIIAAASAKAGKAEAQTPVPETSEAAVVTGGENPPDLALLGWIVGGIGTFVVSHIRTRLQPLGLSCGLTEQRLAAMLFCVSAMQGLTAFLLSFIRSRWQFRVLPALAGGALGVVTLLIFSSVSFKSCFFPAAAVYGIYSGFLYYYFVFYSLMHPARASIYAGINETVVSCNSIAAPLIGGVLAAISLTCPFLISAILVAGATLLHVVVLRRTRQKFPEAVK